MPTPRNLKERCDVAKTCASALKLPMPILIDDMKDSTERAYSSWPDRLFLIDAKGVLTYKSDPGPWGFKPANLRAALKRLLGKTKSGSTSGNF